MNLRQKTNLPEVNTIANLTEKLFRLATAVTFIFSISPSVGAATLASNKMSIPVALSFPSSSEAIEKSLIRFGNGRFQEGFDVTQKLSDVTITDPFALKLSGVKFQGAIRGRLDRDSKGLIIEAALQNLKLSIERISIHSVVKARVGGVDASIRIDAECTASEIYWPGKTISFFARGRLTTVPRLKLDLSGLALPVDLEKPEMSLSCQGPFGIDDAIRDYAWAAIQQRWTDQLFIEDIETKIEESFASALAVGGDGLKLVSQPGMNATMFAEEYTVGAQVGHLRARLELSLDRPVPTLSPAGSVVNLPTGKIDEITVSIPTTAAQAVMKTWLAPGVWSEWIDAQSVEGFRDLMSSRFKQIIAVPDLQNYPKDAPFWFALDMAESPTLQCVAGELHAGVPIGAWMLLKEPSFQIGYKPMVRFSIPTRLSIALPQSKTNRAMSARIESMDMSYAFDTRYIETERPNTIIASEQILDGIKDFAESKIENLTAFEGFVGETAKALNQTNVSCDPSTQVIRIVMPNGI